MLLAKRSAERAFYPGVWDVIGGHCADGEAPGDTLAREVKEEIGVTPCAFDEVAVLAEPHPTKHGEARYHIFVVTRVGWRRTSTKRFGAFRLTLGEPHSRTGPPACAP